LNFVKSTMTYLMHQIYPLHPEADKSGGGATALYCLRD